MRLNFKDPISVMSLGTADSDGGGPLGSLIPGIGDAKAQKDANQTNLREAQLNRDFQKEMSGTAYQRAMEDMKQAGLNPMLAYMQGGASTPSGSTATVQPASKTGMLDKALQAYTGISATQNANTALQQQQAMNESSIQLQSSTAAKNVAETQATVQKIAESREKTEGYRLSNKKGKMYEPAHEVGSRISNKLSGVANNILNFMDTNAKDAQAKNKNSKDPLIRQIKVHGPSSASPLMKFLQGK